MKEFFKVCLEVILVLVYVGIAGLLGYCVGSGYSKLAGGAFEKAIEKISNL